MNSRSKIYVAGHTGLVGKAIVKRLRSLGFSNLVLRTHAELDLADQVAVAHFFEDERPQFVILAAAKVGGILANNTFPAQFIFENLRIQTNVIHESHRNQVDRLLFLGSSCIYPRLAPQPLKESSLMTGPLESTNRPYAVAKIAGIEMCWAYNREYSSRFLAVMPTNLYGPGDNYHPSESHLIPALLLRMHEAKINNHKEVVVWGTGTPRREFLYSEDAADACILLLNLSDEEFDELVTGSDNPPIVNVGSGRDMTVKEIARVIAEIVGYEHALVFDSTKPDGTPRKLMDTSRLDSLGWTAAVDIREGLRRTYEDFCSEVRLDADAMREA